MVETSKILEEKLDSYYLVKSYEVGRICHEEGFAVGCVIVKNNKIISTGCNKIMDGDEYNLCIHAECDAIAKCAWRGVSTENSTLYCNFQPCPDCAKMIVSSKIKKVVYGDTYAIMRYEIVEKESYSEKIRKKEPILARFHYDNSRKIFETNNVELVYIDIYGLMYGLELEESESKIVSNKCDTQSLLDF